MQGKVEISGINTARLKTLKNEEMVQLLRRSREGDEEARQRLIDIAGANIEAFLRGAPVNVVNK